METGAGLWVGGRQGYVLSCEGTARLTTMVVDDFEREGRMARDELIVDRSAADIIC